MMTDGLAELCCVSRSFDGGRITALRDASLTVRQGEILVIFGPSGSGKSTLLGMLSGLDQPTSGHVMFRGRRPASTAEWTRLRAANIGVIFQEFHLLPTLTALENVEIPMFGFLPPRARRSQSRHLLERVGLGHRFGHRSRELSGGERQRVAIARALANSPCLVLADEPTGNLDSAASRTVLSLLVDVVRDRDGALVLATHDKAVADRADRVVQVADGSLVQP